jgi:arylsulfatase A-like enzyme
MTMRAVVWAGLWLGGCGGEPAAELQVAPLELQARQPWSQVLTVGRIVQGHAGMATVGGYDPGSEVKLLVSLAQPQMSWRRGVGIGLDEPIKDAATATADNYGNVELVLQAPDCTAGTEVFFQAVGPVAGVNTASTVTRVVVAANGLPTAPGVALGDPDPLPGDPLWLALSTPSTDPDGDPTSYVTTWTHDGTTVGEMATLEPNLPARIGRWEVEVTAHDGFGRGDVTAIVFDVPSTPPTVSEVALTPAHPRVGDPVACSYVYTDVEGDPDQSTIHWLVDDVEVGTGAVLPVAPTTGQRITCRVDPFDGSSTGASVSTSVRMPGNVLLIVLDDVGVDQLGLYGIGPEVAPTPTIDALASQGVLFRHAYANSECSPTRALIQTGRYAWRTGVGDGIAPADPFTLSHDEVLLPEAVVAGTDGLYTTSLVGKWHLSTLADNYYTHPLDFGWGWYSGAIDGVWEGAYALDGLAMNYYDWERSENGAVARSTTYVENSAVDDALARIAAMPEPWLTQVSFNSPHRPYHVPPADLFAGPALGDTIQKQYYHWMLEAIDTEIAKLLAGIDPAVLASTTVVITADNGSLQNVVDPMFDLSRQKSTLYQGGVHVPLLVAGPLVDTPGREVDSLVAAVDIFATIADLAGADLDPEVEIDGVSFLPYLRDPAQAPLRQYVYAEEFFPLGFGPYDYHDKMIRDERWKLIRYSFHDELYDLAGLDVEGTDLLNSGTPLTPEQDAAYQALVAALPI